MKGTTLSVYAVSLFLLHVSMPMAAETYNSTIDQRKALLVLKAHITSDTSNILSNWSSSGPICSWIGITCDPTSQRVTALNLSYMGLSGTLPSEIQNLSFLGFLSVRNNNFRGSIPDEVAGLLRLKFLDLGLNSFTGIIPPLIGSLPQLETLLLDANKFVGSFPASLSNISSLQRINISYNRLDGVLPSNIFNMSSLQMLDLSFNSLSGRISIEEGDGFVVSQLQEMYLSVNYFTGEIPVSLFERCMQMQVLSLSGNNLTGSIPSEIGNLSALKELYLSDNNLNGIIPSSIGNCSLLKEISLSDNNLMGSIPLAVGNLYNLETLRMDSNDFSGNLPSTLFNISTLKAIAIRANYLSGSLPSDIGIVLPNLTELLLSENQLQGIIPGSIVNASKLTFLDLSNNSFSGLIPSSISNLRQLQVINLAYNHLRSEFTTPDLSLFSLLTNCKHLRTIILSGNPLNTVLPTSIGNLSASLQQLQADNCNIMGSIPREIDNLTNLIALSLGNNDLVGTIPTTIGNLVNLQALDLQNNKLQGIITDDLCHLNSLVDLDFGGNKLSGSIPQCLGDVKTLRHLTLSANRLTSSIPLTLWSLKDILVIKMSSNLLTGSLPSDIQNLTVVINIDLSGNLLSGEIPSSIGNLKNLAYLSLAKNSLQGPIPGELHGALSLVSLDLSYNSLSGVIPKSLESLQHLKYFNVSFNMLHGEIPDEGPFTNFTALSYKMNNGLCGAQRLQLSPCRQKKSTSMSFHFLLSLVIPLIVSIAIAYYLLIWFFWKRRKRQPTSITGSKRYSYQELKQATDGFSEGNLIGRGSVGSVYKGTLRDGMVVAVKVFDVEDENNLRSFDVESEVMHRTRHRNLIRILCSCSGVKFKALVMEYMANGNLEKWLHTHNYHLDMLQRLDIMIDTASAIKYLHYEYSRTIIHCDLKPSNILLDEDMISRVSDFSITKLLQKEQSQHSTSSFLGTIGYVAPELGILGKVSRATDVYSFGIMLMETFSGKKPTDDTFAGEMNLRRWVKESLPDDIEGVVDASLLRAGEDHSEAKLMCLSSIMRLAQVCTEDSPLQRFDIKEIISILVNIKEVYLKKVLGE